MRPTRFLPLGALSLMLLACPAAAMSWRWGMRAGLNGANFGGEFNDIVSSHLRYGLNAGPVAEASLAHALSLRAEVAYSNKGGTAEGTSIDYAGNPQKYTTTWIFDYIEFPILVRARHENSRGAALFGEIGPSFGVPIAGRITSGSPAGLPDLDVKNDMKAVDSGFALGAGVEFAAGAGHLGIEARYTRGFSDLFDLEGNATAINQVWTLALAWMR